MIFEVTLHEAHLRQDGHKIGSPHPSPTLGRGEPKSIEYLEDKECRHSNSQQLHL